ncbi:MAG: hypothetical protein HRT61_01235, partial [Ekhidna sp.]|nr:hypothetical protein [Ekhidna sp.]
AGQFVKAGGKIAMKEALKEMGATSVISFMAGAGSQGLQRAYIPELEVANAEGIKEMLYAGAVSAAADGFVSAGGLAINKITTPQGLKAQVEDSSEVDPLPVVATKVFKNDYGDISDSNQLTMSLEESWKAAVTTNPLAKEAADRTYADIEALRSLQTDLKKQESILERAVTKDTLSEVDQGFVNSRGVEPKKALSDVRKRIKNTEMDLIKKTSEMDSFIAGPSRTRLDNATKVREEVEAEVNRVRDSLAKKEKVTSKTLRDLQRSLTKAVKEESEAFSEFTAQERIQDIYGGLTQSEIDDVLKYHKPRSEETLAKEFEIINAINAKPEQRMVLARLDDKQIEDLYNTPAITTARLDTNEQHRVRDLDFVVPRQEEIYTELTDIEAPFIQDDAPVDIDTVPGLVTNGGNGVPFLPKERTVGSGKYNPKYDYTPKDFEGPDVDVIDLANTVPRKGESHLEAVMRTAGRKPVSAKSSDPKGFASDIFHSLAKSAMSPKQVAKHSPIVAETYNFVRDRTDFATAVGGAMQARFKDLRKKFGDSFQNNLELLETVVINNGRFDPKTKTYVYEANGKTQQLSPEQSTIVKELSDYFQMPLHLMRYRVAENLRIAVPDSPKQKQLKELASRMDSMLETPYMPMMRQGDLFMKVENPDGQDLVVSLRQERRPLPGNRNLGSDDIRVNKGEYEALVDEQKKKYPTAKFPKFKDLKAGQATDNLDNVTSYNRVFQPTDSPKSQLFTELTSLKGLIENSEFERALRQIDSDNKIEIDLSSAMTRMFEPKKNVPGYSRDFVGIANTWASLGGKMASDFAFADQGKDLANTLRSNAKEGYARKLWQHVMEPEHAKWENDLGRLQSFMGLGFRVSTAALQPLALTSSLPWAVSPYINTTNMYKAMFPEMGKAASLATRHMADKGWSLYDVDDVMKVVKDRKVAEDIVRMAPTLATNLKDDFIGSVPARPIRGAMQTIENAAYIPMETTEVFARINAYLGLRKEFAKPEVVQRAKDYYSRQKDFTSHLENRGARSVEDVLAARAIEEGFGVFGAKGRAPMQRGPGRLVLPFSTYALQASETLVSRAASVMNGKGTLEERRRIASSLVMSSLSIMGIAGLAGAPFWNQMSTAYELITKNNLETEILKMVPDDTTAKMFAEHGLLGIGGNIAIGERVSVSDPYTLFVANLGKFGSANPADSLGFLLPKIGRISQAVSEGNVDGIVMNSSPAWVSDLYRAEDYMSGEGVRTSRGTRITEYEPDGADIITRALGFDSPKIASEKDAYYNTVSRKRSVTSSKVSKQLADILMDMEKDPENRDSYIAEIQDLREGLKKRYDARGLPFTKEKWEGVVRSARNRVANMKQGPVGDGRKTPGLNDEDSRFMEEERRARGLE